MEYSSKKIGVIGLWHLGCVLCAAWSELGHEVIGYDPDNDRVSGLKDGEPPLYEPGLADSHKNAMAKGLLSFSVSSEDLSDCDFIFLSYDTPVNDDDSSDTTILEESISSVAPVMKDGSILVISSQSPVGFCSKMRDELKKVNPSLELAYSPENLRLGEAIDCYLNPGRIILGTADVSAETSCSGLFSEIPGELLSMGLESSEMVKHGINSFLSTSIVFANHLADICETSGARIDDVVRGMKSDPRIGAKAYLAPGIGFSGGTLGRDLKVLSSENLAAEGDAILFETVHASNASRKNTIVKRVGSILGDISGSKVLILGATYKPGTSTLRRSLPLEVASLLNEGGADVHVYDPKADYSELTGEPCFTIAESIDAGAEGADMLLLLTDWPEFKDHNWQVTAGTMTAPHFFDAKNFLDESTMKAAGFDCYSIGRG